MRETINESAPSRSSVRMFLDLFNYMLHQPEDYEKTFQILKSSEESQEIIDAYSEVIKKVKQYKVKNAKNIKQVNKVTKKYDKQLGRLYDGNDRYFEKAARENAEKRRAKEDLQTAKNNSLREDVVRLSGETIDESLGAVVTLGAMAGVGLAAVIKKCIEEKKIKKWKFASLKNNVINNIGSIEKEVGKDSIHCFIKNNGNSIEFSFVPSSDFVEKYTEDGEIDMDAFLDEYKEIIEKRLAALNKSVIDNSESEEAARKLISSIARIYVNNYMVYTDSMSNKDKKRMESILKDLVSKEYDGATITVKTFNSEKDV